MNLLGRFFKDQIKFIVIYILAVVSIIGFFCLTVHKAEIIYPTFIAVFFLLLFLCISFITYYIHDKNLNALKLNPGIYDSSSNEYLKTYDCINQIYERYNQTISSMNKTLVDDRRFMSGFIHNLKTPVTVSSIIVQRVKNNELSPEEALSLLEEELLRLNEGLDNLLSLKRLEEVEKDFSPVVVDLLEEITKAINKNKSLFINSHVYPKINVEKEYLVYSDEKWNQVLLNQIISNAVKYSKKNTHVFFSIEQEKEHVILVIKDEGIGIPENDLSRVFEPFFTGENGRKGFNSSGIGLYMCKKIVDSLGQDIKLENDNGCKVSISYLSKL